MFFKTIRTERFVIRLLLVICFLLPFFWTFPVWLSERIFPRVPLIFLGLSLNYQMELFLLFVFGVTLLWFLIKDKGYGGLFFFLTYVILCLLDQTRIQPFFFEIAIIIFLYCLFRNNIKYFKIAFLILMAGTYIWSGLHKAHPFFYEVWYGGLEKRIPFVPQILRQLFTWMVPFLEFSFGLTLLFNKTRKLGIWMLGLMHSLILITFLVSGIGFTVFPLNVINVLFLFWLCYRLDWTIINFKNINLKLKVIAFYALILPAFNLIGLYDHFLAFSYFSGKPDYCNIIFKNENGTKALPEGIKKIVRTYEGQYYLNVNEWSVNNVKVLCYPEDRVYSYLQSYIEQFSGKGTTAIQLYKK